MSVDSISAFVDMLMTSRILSADQIHTVTKELLTRIRDARGLAKELMQRGWLTVFQVNQIFQGHGRDLVLGPYRILDVLGEGGVATVYRAWHANRKHVVALKTVRKELLANQEAVRQFQQETKTIASLSHPNIVQTLEADCINGTHFMAMEFIEGLDLNKLVRLSGPLPIIQACDYIRQAALGLQHAHERCLVHRDIKPANLFLVSPSGQGGDDTKKNVQMGGVIKILDWGLADMRLPAATGQQEAANTLMREETIGTADYLAPEQAVDATKVDIRADIYSLGCAFYYLLSGQPPFGGGSLMQKLLKHREAEPPPIQSKRADLPPGLWPVLLKMLAKKPEDRYRTPASVAAGLSGFARGGAARTTMSGMPAVDPKLKPAEPDNSPKPVS
jgi:serine/threonine-protein kinase